jgi:hypothetical protein
MLEDDGESRDVGRGAPFLVRMTPAAPASTHLMLAAAMWSVVGAVMLAFGVAWVWYARGPDLRPFIAVAALLAGVKSRFVLDRAARRIVRRIRARGDERCIGGVLSPRSWFLVALMAVSGSWLRHGHLSRSLLGLLYLAVGAALLLSSRLIWRAWRASRP